MPCSSIQLKLRVHTDLFCLPTEFSPVLDKLSTDILDDLEANILIPINVTKKLID